MNLKQEQGIPIQEKKKWYKPDSPKKVLMEKCVKEGLSNILSDVIKHYDNNSKLYFTSREILKTIFVIGIFNDIHKKLNLYRDENKAMLISDTNNLLRSVIGTSSSPFIYEKIGSYYSHFLVDEFQDTSTLQWRNLLPLVTDSLSEQNVSMVVGDVKQSIYRWRNGNMKLLLTDIYDDLSAHKEQFNEQQLLDNRRSRHDIIEFNNRFFTSAPQVLVQRTESGNSNVITEAYSEVKQAPHKTGSGYVRIEFIPAPEEGDKTADEIADEHLLNIVGDLETGGVNTGDILILTRKKKEASRAAGLLLDAGKNVISDESLLLYNSPKVKLILSLFKHFTSPDDNITSAEILHNFRMLNNGSVKSEFGDDFESMSITDKLKKLLSQTFSDENYNYGNVSLYELTERLISEFKLNSEPDAYLLRFQDAVLEYTAGFDNSIVNFLNWWEIKQKSISIITPAGNDAIRIMTIHKAKGLESPVVIIPYANWELDLDGNKDFFWVSSAKSPFEKYSSAYYVRAAKDMPKTFFTDQYYEEAIATNIDNLNLLYVAFTRASEMLYVMCPQKGRTTFDDGKIAENIKDHKRINAAQLIKHIIATEDTLKKCYDTNTGVFEYGAKTQVTGRKPGKESVQIKKYVSSGWIGKLVNEDRS